MDDWTAIWRVARPQVFPGARGSVVTTSAISLVSPTRLAVTIENTRVVGSNLLPQLLDPLVVPVKVSRHCRCDVLLVGTYWWW
jgi:hypothetical protein